MSHTPNISINVDPTAMASAAADLAAEHLRQAIADRGSATCIAATGASQIEFLNQLATRPGIDWSRITMFHLDEYLGLPSDHPASFVRYLRERLIDRVHPGTVHLIDGNAADPHAEVARLSSLIRQHTVDIAFVGIGENGHLAFNDPPADLLTTQPYLVVELDQACRRQQLGEGWFPTLADVPRQAISMSIHEILRTRTIVCSVPDQRKALAVRNCLSGPITPLHPASALQRHADCHVFLDQAAATLLPTVG